MSSSPQLSALLIDLDGVLRIWDAAPTDEIERAAGLPAGAIARVAFAPELLLPAIRGEIADEQWRRQITARLHADHPEIDARAAVALWSAPAGRIDGEVLATVRTCRARVPVALVTNATSRLEDDLARLGVAQEFDHVVNSSKVGAIKPEAAIFTAALGVAGVEARQALFVDDNAEFAAAAERLGMTGHHFRDAASLRAALRGILD